MMKNKYLIGFLLISISSVAGYFSYRYYTGGTEVISPKEEKVAVTENNTASARKKTITKEQKLEQFKRRMNFRSVLRKWDFYSIKNMKETALQYYLSAYKKLPSDHVIEKKIWDTYFEMKLFQKAYSFYIRIPSSEADEKLNDRILKTLLYTWNKNMRDEFNKIDASEKLKTYYDKVLVCYTWMKNCIMEFKTYSWSLDKITKIRDDLVDYANVTRADPNSRYAKLAWDFLENKDFLASAILWEEILNNRPNYTSVLKITWYAYYELGDYKKSNEYLQKYYAIDPKDVTVTYMLWIINFYTEDYISSNLYFNAAVLNWYRPKNELQKRLAYNYYILWDKKNMLKVFRYILDEEDVTPDDFAVALYTSIEEKEYSKSMLWANKWIDKFGQSDMIYAFRWWLYRLRGEEGKAIDDFKTALEINARNAAVLYNLWVLAFEKNEYNTAKWYFENTIEVDKNGTFWDEANFKLREINARIEEEAAANAASSSWNTSTWEVN